MVTADYGPVYITKMNSVIRQSHSHSQYMGTLAATDDMGTPASTVLFYGILARALVLPSLRSL